MTRIVDEFKSVESIPDRALHSDGSNSDDENKNRLGGKETIYTIGGETGQRVQTRVGTSRPKRKRTPKRLSRIMTLEIAAREYVWLWDLRRGLSTEVIAAREGVSVRRVRFGIARSLGQEKSFPVERNVRPPRLVPLFPVGLYTPNSSCAHHRPIECGSLLCCMVCHRSGMDDHPALRRDSATDPAPELKPTPTVQRTSLETRRERRQRLYGLHIKRGSKAAAQKS
jgi:hypothetical protein